MLVYLCLHFVSEQSTAVAVAIFQSLAYMHVMALAGSIIMKHVSLVA